jgi:hypothetical protein
MTSTCPIFGQYILVLKSGKKMISILFAEILNTKIIDSKDESHAMGVVLP